MIHMTKILTAIALTVLTACAADSDDPHALTSCGSAWSYNEHATSCEAACASTTPGQFAGSGSAAWCTYTNVVRSAPFNVPPYNQSSCVPIQSGGAWGCCAPANTVADGASSDEIDFVECEAK